MLSSLIEPLETFGRFVDFSARVLAAIPQALRRRPGQVADQFERVTWGSLPIVIIAGLSVGLVTWLQTYRQLSAYGIEATLPSFLAPAVLVELGPMLAGLLVAGRMGAGLAAELGSMTLTEEIEARTILGAWPISSLVAPRTLACALAVPFLTVVIDSAAILGGMLAEVAGGTLSMGLFWQKSLLYLRLSDVIPATLKTSVFGFLIGVTGCWTGLNTPRSTEGVGKAATRGVVRSMFAVFVANVILVPCLQTLTRALRWTS